MADFYGNGPLPPVSRSQRRGVLYFRAFPMDLKHLFKAWCARRGISMKEKIEDLMRDTIKTDDKQAAKRLRQQKERA